MILRAVKRPTAWLFVAVLVVTPACERNPEEAHSALPTDLPVKRLARDPGGVLAPRTELLFDGSGRSELHPLLVDLAPRVDLETMAPQLRSMARDRRRPRLREGLVAVAESARMEIEPLLAALEEDGHLRRGRTHRIVPRLEVRADLEGLRRLSGHPAVVRIRPAPRRDTSRPPKMPVPPVPVPEPGQSWALEDLGVAAARRRGLDGEGVVIAVLDSGVDPDHPALSAGAPGREGLYGPVLSGPEGPWHATGVLGLAVGAGVGVAPGAAWRVAVPDPGGAFSLAEMTAALEWVLFESDADVLAVPLQISGLGDRDPGLGELFSALKAGGIFLVFAAGNTGPRPGSHDLPASLQDLWPGGASAFSVGAYGLDASPYLRSSRGPGPEGALFPLAAAPGEDLPTAWGGKSPWASVSGTSFAAGLAAGIVALLRQAAPELGVVELEEVLLETARDLGDPGPDPAFGHGGLDLAAALEHIQTLPTSVTEEVETK